jgi:pimeloyl-ACP methyl ester carboxylesterase
MLNKCNRFVAAVAVILIILSQAFNAAPAEAKYVKQFNFVFLHGMGGTRCALQRLDDWFKQVVEVYVTNYEQQHPDTTIQVDTMFRCYPAYSDIDTWARNIAESIDDFFPNKENIVLVGHSMGGKTALYAVAHNIGGLQSRVAAVVTINSPIKNLNQYYTPGGGPALNYCITGLLGSNEGVCGAVVNYDSTEDGKWVGANKHWLAFVSAENSPFSSLYDRNGVDAWPREMDDGIVPISAQYSDGADVIYYGAHGHSDFSNSDVLSSFIAGETCKYLFGLPVKCVTFASRGTIEHTADWLVGEDYWKQDVGQIIAASGTLTHKNNSFKWVEWSDVLGEAQLISERSSTVLARDSFPLFTSIKKAEWYDSVNKFDGRLSISTGAAPFSTVQVNWTIYRRPLLAPIETRAYYEISIIEGTPLTSISSIVWTNENIRDTGLTITSQAQSPFRWFKAEWRVFKFKTVQIDILQGLSRTLVQ